MPWAQSEAQAANLKKQHEHEPATTPTSAEAHVAGGVDDWCAASPDYVCGGWCYLM